MKEDATCVALKNSIVRASRGRLGGSVVLYSINCVGG